MNRTTYEITMSTDGTHKVTVTVEDPGGIDAALAYAQGTYAKLMQPGRLSLAEPVGEAPPQCGVHRIAMVLVQGKKGPFWSCHQKNIDGSWCSYKPL